MKRGGIIIRALAFVLILLVLSPFLATAQQQAESGANCDLSVSVRSVDERSIDVPFQVEVHSARGLLATVHIFGAEPAQFRVANGKTYSLRVTGNGFEAVTTSYFEINPLETLHTETVHMKPESQAPAGESTSGSPTISVNEMNIPKKASAEMKKGLDAYSKGDLEKATAHFERAIAEYPRYARAFDMLGAIAMKGSNRVKARELFSKSIEADGAFLPAYVDLARIYLQDQNYVESESLLARAIAINPSVPDAMALLATTEFASKEYDKALADVERTHGLRNHEQFAEVHIMAGKVLALQNRPGAAIVQFQLFLIEKPDSPQGESVRKALVSLEAGQLP
jgi:tetratricopeptide (TPR) repeat protein